MSDEVFLADAADTRGCPFCGETIKAVARKCRYCGELLGDPNSPGVFRDGKKVVLSRTALLPSRCFKTGEPTTTWLARTLYKQSPVALLGLVFGPIGYAIVAVLTQKKVDVRIPLSQERIKRRRNNILLAWVIAIAGITGIIAGGVMMDQNESLGALALGAGVLTLIGGLIMVIVVSNPASAAQIDDDYVWIKGAHPLFLAELPEWAGK
jgi:hypothetical protein